MNRNDEYNDLLNEIDHTPIELENTLNRAQKKYKSNRRQHAFMVGLTCLSSFILIFIILVNSSTSIAYACGKIPVLKDLAQLVTLSPSLSAAVENEYVQPIELEQTDADITAKIEYVIVDQKQLNIFYSLDSKIYSAMVDDPQIKSETGDAIGGYALSHGSYDRKNGELRQITVDFVDLNMPNSIQLILKVRDVGSFEATEELVPDENYNPNEWEYVEPEYITQFTFLLEIDPYFTAQGETLTLNQDFEIDGQIITITTVDIYPTHLRINLDDNETNTAWLTSMEFYIENEKGERFDHITNGITATGDPDSPMMVSHRLESTYFSNSKYLKLYITDVTWIDKDRERIKVDLENKKAEILPQNVEFTSVKRNKDNWTLKFLCESKKENSSYQIWATNYYDEEGNEYSYNSWSTGTGGFYDEELGKFIESPTQFNVEFTLYDYPYDIVYLVPNYTRIVELTSPIEIIIK